MPSLKFPKNFYWGAATSAHQVEGGNENDWIEWERANSRRLAGKASKKQWPDFILKNYPNPLQEENYISDRAADHYNRFKEDFDIAKSLSHNAHSFSIEWSRIEPARGEFNQAEIEHYRRILESLRSRNIEPFVSLWHWTNPLWIRDQSGWENRRTIDEFLRYAEKVVGEYKNLVRFWTVFNEPSAYVGLGYLLGTQPPAIKNLLKAGRVLKNFSKTHRRAYEIIHQADKNAQVGISHFYLYSLPYKNRFWNKFLVWVGDCVGNRLPIRETRNKFDFFGLHYYNINLIRLSISRRQGRFLKNDDDPAYQKNDLGWTTYPEGIYHALKSVSRYGKPIYITENGTADARDIDRSSFIKEHLRWVGKAIGEGIDVRGYLYWSLLDNFEIPWVNGFWPRFGLVEVDYRTLERKIRPSAWEYKKIIESGEIN